MGRRRKRRSQRRNAPIVGLGVREPRDLHVGADGADAVPADCHDRPAGTMVVQQSCPARFRAAVRQVGWRVRQLLVIQKDEEPLLRSDEPGPAPHEVAVGGGLDPPERGGEE